MSLLVTAAELWANILGGLDTFLGHPLVQKLGTWLDTGLIGAGIFIGYKYVLPRLVENAALRKQLDESEKTIKQVVQLLETTVQNITGVKLDLVSRVDGLINVINTAFQNSNLDTKAKTIIGSVVQQMILGQPVDLMAAATQLSDEGKGLMESITTAATTMMEETKQTALDQLAAQAEAELTKTQEG
jgi:hypothetical protein